MENRIKRIYSALSSLGNGDLAKIRPHFSNLPVGFQMMVDFNQNSDPAELENSAQLLIANIASIRDHLKKWCDDRKVVFKGDDLINSNKSVAIVHDLWNTDKHAHLSRPPRSGFLPKLKDLRRTMVLTTGIGPNSGISFSMDMEGNQRIHSENGGSAKLEVVAQITDQNGNDIGDFRKTCDEAIEAWSEELIVAGVPLAVFS